MTLTEIADRVAQKVGAPYELTWGFMQETIKEIVGALNQGEEVKIRGLGRFYWAEVKEKKIITPLGQVVATRAGRKLKFLPAAEFRTRREPNEGQG